MKKLIKTKTWCQKSEFEYEYRLPVREELISYNVRLCFHVLLFKIEKCVGKKNQ